MRAVINVSAFFMGVSSLLTHKGTFAKKEFAGKSRRRKKQDSHLSPQNLTC